MKAAAALALVLAAVPVAAGARVATPRPGSAERADIMDAIRAGTHSSATFLVDYLRVTSGRPVNFAYAEVRPSRADTPIPFQGPAFLVKVGAQWKMAWAIGDGGSWPCSNLARGQTRAVEMVGSDATQLFSREFFDALRDRKRDASDNLECDGDLISGKP